MSDSREAQPAAEMPGDSVETDPDIQALLDFSPVPRAREMENAWTPELQREFIARLAVHGSATKACEEMGKNRTGVTKLYRSPEGASFRDAWHAAVELAKERRTAAVQLVAPGAVPPTIDNRRKRAALPVGPLPGQVMNEHGQWEDEGSYLRRADDARDSVSMKLLRCRRLYLQEISDSPGKRAAFEILTELPIDWEKAVRGEAQADEPYNPANQRQPDMILTAESGWLHGEGGYGPDRKAAARKAVDEWRAEQGLEPVDWSESAESSDAD